MTILIVVFAILVFLLTLLVVLFPMHRVLRSAYAELSPYRPIILRGSLSYDEYVDISRRVDVWPILENNAPYHRAKKRTLLVYVPGGGMFIGQLRDPDFFRAIKYWYDDAYCVWTRYRLAPESVDPTAVHDVARQIEQELRAGEYEKIMIVGFSAGAYIAWKLSVMMAHDDPRSFDSPHSSLNVRTEFPHISRMRDSTHWFLLGGYYNLATCVFNNRDVSSFFRRWTRLHLGGSDDRARHQDPFYRYLHDNVDLTRYAGYHIADRLTDSLVHQAQLLYEALHARGVRASLIIETTESQKQVDTFDVARIIRRHLFVHRTRNNSFATYLLKYILTQQ